MRSISLAILAVTSGLALLPCPALAADIALIGLFPGKAVLVIDNGAPKTYAVGSTIASDSKLIDVSSSAAVIETNGRRQTLTLDGYVAHAAGSHSGASSGKVILMPDSKGHYMAQGQINGGAIRMLLDTGASTIALPASDAIRLGIDYKKGKVGRTNTANGVTQVYRVMLDTVKIGDIQINQVEAAVHESGLPFALLGMSFLSRVEMRNEGGQMMLTKRY
ncbi:MAG: TIGR02281 family clan AA aspartic protease [Proteobacteria bacterium]|nr:TIGR02281 family clan AA aspartic protease [Pseudomonadota bacterium]